MKYFIKEYETRYFAGIEFPEGVSSIKDVKKIPELWNQLFNMNPDEIPDKTNPEHYIGLEIYPFDFQETKTFYYYAMVRTNGLIDATDSIVTKKLKAGRYICFPIEFDRIKEEIQKVYQYIKQENIKVHMGFDYEDYLVEENYRIPGAIVNFCLLLDQKDE